MQATTMAETSPMSPYDLLRPMRCLYEFGPGVKCTGRASDIDWSTPGMHAFRCPKCKTMNCIRIVEVAGER